MKTKTKRKSKKLPPIVLLICYIIMLLMPLLLLIPKRKKPTMEELLVRYPRLNNGVSMTESRKILNKNGVFYSDEEIERLNKVMELLADAYYKHTRGKLGLISI